MISEKLLNYWYPDEQKNGTLIFYNWIRQYTDLQKKILNLGAGATTGSPLRTLRREVARVVGADIDPVVLSNDELDEAHQVDGIHLPFEDHYFDIVLSDFVLEHVEFPEPFLREVHRVLKPGGSFFFRTPNVYHYVSLIAWCTPQWFHELFANRARGLPRDAHEPYPTFHRLNTTRKIRKLARRIGFSEIALRHIECQPSYLVFSTIPFLAGVFYERVTNKFDCLSGIRANILGRLER